MSVLMEISFAATAALSAGRREAGFMAEGGEKDNHARMRVPRTRRLRRDPGSSFLSF
jgi:hypothetical protein